MKTLKGSDDDDFFITISYSASNSTRIGNNTLASIRQNDPLFFLNNGHFEGIEIYEPVTPPNEPVAAGKTLKFKLKNVSALAGIGSFAISVITLYGVQNSGIIIKGDNIINTEIHNYIIPKEDVTEKEIIDSLKQIIKKQNIDKAKSEKIIKELKTNRWKKIK